MSRLNRLARQDGARFGAATSSCPCSWPHCRLACTSVGARGVVELGRDTEVTPDTPFVTGSISKSFTALALMQLVEAGEVDLDTEVSQYLEGFSDLPAGAITARQLLSHTSGFSALQVNESHTDDTSGKDELARRVDALADVTPAYRPDEWWEYSNTTIRFLAA